MDLDHGSGVRVLEDPLTNKGTAFGEEERSALGLLKPRSGFAPSPWANLPDPLPVLIGCSQLTTCGLHSLEEQGKCLRQTVTSNTARHGANLPTTADRESTCWPTENEVLPRSELMEEQDVLLSDLE